MELQKADAAVVIEEKDLTGEKLVSTVSDMLAQPASWLRWAKMPAACRWMTALTVLQTL